MKNLPSLLFGLLSCVFVFSSAADAQSYRVLLSNDDGIESPQLAALKQALESLPGVEVLVSAPHENQSGAGQATGPDRLIVDRVYRDGSLFGYAVHGEPAEAVRFATVMLAGDEGFDLVVSGINQGANVGNVSHHSGTVGAAFEGHYQGIPSIAISQEARGADTERSARFAAVLVQRYQREGAPPGMILSVNIPAGELKGVRVRPMGDAYLKTVDYEIREESENTTTYQRRRIRQRGTDPSSDTFSYQEGYIVLTPLKFDWTDHEAIGEVTAWGLRLVD
ncbi:MAG TPA: 5'/3'-nucleotidase SurE [Gemmatimonadetes bacterium]|nr:5'/3'-nucleotidase SurE [Gemmatimonadota bacterium]